MGVPSIKETTLHHFRCPLVKKLANDPDINFLGVALLGSPQDNKMKHLVGRRLAVWLEAMRCNGVVISQDCWGNSDIDFANTMFEVGERDISIIGLKFSGKHADFIAPNKYTNLVIDINKNELGIETERVGENSITEEDANKALAFIKLKMRQDGHLD